MKKILFFSFLALTAVSVTSCSRDEATSTTPQPKYDVVGNWKMNEYKNAAGAWQSMQMLNYYINLKSDGTYTTNYMGTPDGGTYKYDNNSQVVTTSPTYGKSIINIKTMTGTNAEVSMYKESAPADVVDLRLVKN